MYRKVDISVPATDDREFEAVRDVIRSGWLTQGPRVAEFENLFAEFIGVSEAIAVSSCTAALHLALLALGVTKGDEVIVPSLTWIATANAVEYCGATPVFVDVDPHTYVTSAASISAKVTPKTKAVIVVHLFGFCANMAEIKRAIPNHIKIVEDCACAAGAMTDGKLAGTQSDIAAFSFHPRKSITTGEGGMLVTSSLELASKLRSLRNHGAEVSKGDVGPHVMPEFSSVGYNYRMTDIQAAIGIVQLSKLDAFTDERAALAEVYLNALHGIHCLSLPVVPKNVTHSWQSFVVSVDERLSPIPRNLVMQKLMDSGISTRPGTHAVHMLEYYKTKYQLDADSLPGAKSCYLNSIALPLHNRMTEEDTNFVVAQLKNILSG